MALAPPAGGSMGPSCSVQLSFRADGHDGEVAMKLTREVDPSAVGPGVLSRRRLLQAGLLGGAMLAVEACVPPRASLRYGPLGWPDANGLQLAAGFSSRVVAREGDLVGGTSYRIVTSTDSEPASTPSTNAVTVIV